MRPPGKYHAVASGPGRLAWPWPPSPESKTGERACLRPLACWLPWRLPGLPVQCLQLLQGQGGQAGEAGLFALGVLSLAELGRGRRVLAYVVGHVLSLAGVGQG